MEELLAINPYNPDIFPDLENYVNEQVSSQTYSLDVNLCLLRFYQYQPERMSTQIVSRILVKALMAMPASDFSQCLFLIPERVTKGLNIFYPRPFLFVKKSIYLSQSQFQQMEEPFKTLFVLSNYLETARFRQFWEEVSKSRNIVEVVPGFEQAMQAYAIHVLSLTYQKVPRSVLAEAINLEGPSLDKFLEHHVANNGWKLEKGQGGGQLIVLPRSEFNQPELKKNSADIIPLERVARIFPIL